MLIIMVALNCYTSPLTFGVRLLRLIPPSADTNLTIERSVFRPCAATWAEFLKTTGWALSVKVDY